MGPSIKIVIQKGMGGDVMSLVRKGRHFKDFFFFYFLWRRGSEIDS